MTQAGVDQEVVDSEVKRIKDQLVDKYKAQKVVLFGSAVSGNMTRDSDLDFLVVKDDTKGFRERVAEVYTLIEKSMPADFIVYTSKELAQKIRLGDPFVREILNNGRVLYG